MSSVVEGVRADTRDSSHALSAFSNLAVRVLIPYVVSLLLPALAAATLALLVVDWAGAAPRLLPSALLPLPPPSALLLLLLLLMVGTWGASLLLFAGFTSLVGRRRPRRGNLPRTRGELKDLPRRFAVEAGPAERIDGVRVVGTLGLTSHWLPPPRHHSMGWTVTFLLWYHASRWALGWRDRGRRRGSCGSGSGCGCGCVRRVWRFFDYGLPEALLHVDGRILAEPHPLRGAWSWGTHTAKASAEAAAQAAEKAATSTTEATVEEAANTPSDNRITTPARLFCLANGYVGYRGLLFDDTRVILDRNTSRGALEELCRWQRNVAWVGGAEVDFEARTAPKPVAARAAVETAVGTTAATAEVKAGVPTCVQTSDALMRCGRDGDRAGGDAGGRAGGDGAHAAAAGREAHATHPRPRRAARAAGHAARAPPGGGAGGRP